MSRYNPVYVLVLTLRKLGCKLAVRLSTRDSDYAELARTTTPLVTGMDCHERLNSADL